MRHWRPAKENLHLRQITENGVPQHLLSGIGIDIQLHRLSARTESPQWGLRSFTLPALTSFADCAWPGPWPGGLQADRARDEDILQAFGSPSLNGGGLLVFDIAEAAHTPYALSCFFEPGGLLQTLSLTRLAEWRSLEEPNTMAGRQGAHP